MFPIETIEKLREIGEFAQALGVTVEIKRQGIKLSAFGPAGDAITTIRFEEIAQMGAPADALRSEIDRIRRHVGTFVR